MSEQRRIVGLIPAAGRASRLSPLPCSKELVPIGMDCIGEDGALRPKVVSHYLLERFVAAGVSEVFVVLRKGKWDIPDYYGDGSLGATRMAYLVTDGTLGHPFTLDEAYPFVARDLVAFGYPDILFDPKDAFVSLASRQVETGADCVLGAFPLRPDQSWDVLEFDACDRIRTISAQESSNAGPERWGWSIALWTPSFTAFMHHYLAELTATGSNRLAEGEITLDHVFQAAIDDGSAIDHVLFPDGYVLDVGTPENLIIAQRKALARNFPVD